MMNYDSLILKLDSFFRGLGFELVETQSRKSILAACEDPNTISTYTIGNEIYPLPQTGQMHLEKILLENPLKHGVFCHTTSYRNEPDPIPGRHDIIFPMFEFEGQGNVYDLMKLEGMLLAWLGISIYPLKSVPYLQACQHFETETIEFWHEAELSRLHGYVVFLHSFPFSSHPFWNMKHKGDNLYEKVDVILNGIETIGSAERSCDRKRMRQDFYKVSDGQYAQKLFDLFGQERVEVELEDYLSHEFFPRFGGGIGVTRLLRTLKRLNDE